MKENNFSIHLIPHLEHLEIHSLIMQMRCIIYVCMYVYKTVQKSVLLSEGQGLLLLTELLDLVPL